MSYDLAVWEGQRPADDRAAGRVFTDLFDRYLEPDADSPPTERIAAYVAALVERWGDVTDDVKDASPWAAGPLIGGAGGPLVYFPMSWSRAEEVSAWAAALADSMGLVCFDPQQNRLRS
ncbi:MULTISPECIES: hypothetical protein [Streptomyces]|uniref:Uncharacterized protein n=1 Tax=Streptomyces plicatus TaxID=1922 RepID=A0ABW1Y4F0_STRPL|nr:MULTISPECIES: hypothetical protein [Streptomyces]RIH60544.1 hypothetical protein D3C59_17620 [Streptomyces sp. SHP22-7]RSS66259.1 hypothetical protein EF907_15960 [Streptomyces sp. WAC06273]GGZ88815.1 hypothetical protein GCM10010301_71360 [Streptomyces plicatus]GHC45032.1 hypothetical protein GCM10010308_75330 [Streptomyces vinaceusdrappus]